MTKIWKIVFVGIAFAMPATAFAAGAGAGSGASPNPVIPNPVPGGLTLVPGTVVVPGVGGSAHRDGALAGTIDRLSPHLNPGLGPMPNPDAAGNGSTPLSPALIIPKSRCPTPAKARYRKASRPNLARQASVQPGYRTNSPTAFRLARPAHPETEPVGRGIASKLRCALERFSIRLNRKPL
jgi:hypothetical protein